VPVKYSSGPLSEGCEPFRRKSIVKLLLGLKPSLILQCYE
jgi:hypothetical protein